MTNGEGAAASPDKGLSTATAHALLQQVGPNEIPEEPPHRLRSFLRRFSGPVAWMLEVALVLELLLGKLPEAVILAGLLVFNALLADFQEQRAQSALQLLRHRLQIMARVYRDGKWDSVPARDLVPGDLVHLKMGSIVPADCRIVQGEVDVDQSSLTGESVPVASAAGSSLYSSSVVQLGEAEAIVTETGTHSYYGKTAELVRSAQGQSHLETLLFGIVRYLVIFDTTFSLAVLGVGAARGVPWSDLAPFVLILLIASVPVALPAAFTIANAIESRQLVESGVLVTSLPAVQEAASMDVLCVDKTGTLTEGKETFGGLETFPGFTETDLLSLASAACDVSGGSMLDRAILDELSRRGIPLLARSQFLPFSPKLRRSEATAQFRGSTVRVLLGSPPTLETLLPSPAPGLSDRVQTLASTGARVLAVAMDPGTGPELAGLIGLSDPPRADAASLILSLRKMGVQVIMLTGDTPETARAIAQKVGLSGPLGTRADLEKDPSRFEGFAGILPEDKFHLVKALQTRHHVTGMTGDGVNDAPALRQAEVGIAVSGGTDVAKSAARLVLTLSGLTNIVQAVEGGRRVYRRMLTWTLTKVSKNFELVPLLSLGFLFGGIFITTPILILLMVFANDFTSMSVGGDHARPSSGPDRWNLPEIAATSAVVGISWLGFSFTLLAWSIYVAHLPLATLQTFFFVYLTLSSQGSLLLVRENGPLWGSLPARGLLLSIVGADIAIGAMALTGTLMAPLPDSLYLLLWLLVIPYALVVDQVKQVFLRFTGAFSPRSRFVRRDESSGGSGA